MSPAGYLDTLDDSGDVTRDGLSQRLMVTRALPAVYERIWRPGWGRVLMGFTGPGTTEEARIARLMMGLGPGDGVLDVACGPGNFTRGFARAVGGSGIAVGIDASAPMLERAVREQAAGAIDNIAYVRGDATRMPFVADSFDAVCCFGALYLIDDPLATIDEITRVLNPGGRVAIMTSVRRQATPGALTSVIRRASGVRVFEREEIVSALAERGFADVHQRVSGLAQFVGGRLGA